MTCFICFVPCMPILAQYISLVITYVFRADLSGRIMSLPNGLFHTFLSVLNCADLKKMFSPALLPCSMSFVNVCNCQHAYFVTRGCPHVLFCDQRITTWIRIVAK